MSVFLALSFCGVDPRFLSSEIGCPEGWGKLSGMSSFSSYSWK